MMIELPIEKYSLKSRAGGVIDEPEDKALPIWSGIIPIECVKGAPITAPDSEGIDIPTHIA